MAKFILSAFADEYSKNFDEQLIGLAENDIHNIELRGVNNKNVDKLTLDEVKEVKKKLDDCGIGLSAVGSPIGKIKITDDFDAHLELLRHVIEEAHILGTDRIRMFSFYLPEGENANKYRGQVMDRLSAMLDIAEKENVLLCNENEKGIYCDISERALDVQRYFGGKIKCVFDHANYLCCNDEPYPKAYQMLKDEIFYMHIKDYLLPEKRMARAGFGSGKIKETLADLNKFDKTYYLTLEPHLVVFNGLSNLQANDENCKVIDQYPTSALAFKAAADALKDCLPQ